MPRIKNQLPQLKLLLKYLLVIVLPPTLFLGVLRALIFNQQFYQFLQQQTDVYLTFGDDFLVNSQTTTIIQFLQGSRYLDNTFLSPQAIIHLSDVRQLIMLMDGLLIVCSIALIAMVTVMIFRRWYASLLLAVQTAALLTVLTMLVLAIAVMVSFDQLFWQFHEQVFPNDLWLFPPHDTLVNLFPQHFFVLFTQWLYCLVFGIAIMVGVAALCLRRLSRLSKDRR